MLKESRPSNRFVLVSLMCVLIQALLHALFADEVKSVERLVRCSDLVILAKVKETLHDGVDAGLGGMVHTRHVLEVKTYYIGSGPQEITVLTPGGFWRDPNGVEHYTTISGYTGIDVRPGELFLAFLQVLQPAYRFVNGNSAKASVAAVDSSGEQTVSLRFDTVDLLGDSARDRYEQLKAHLESLTAEERNIETRRLENALTEVVPVADLSSRIEAVLKVVGGPKPPTTICY